MKNIIFFKPLLVLAVIAYMLCNTTILLAQSDMPTAKSKKSFYIEGGGNALAFSVNYDARFKKKNNGLGYRIGIGGFTNIGNGNLSLLAIPVQINYLAGTGAHFFEAGIGATYTTNGFWEDQYITDKTPVLGTVTFGYRYQPVGSGFLLRIGMTPFFGSVKEVTEYIYDPITFELTDVVIGEKPLFWPLYGGISVGYTF